MEPFWKRVGESSRVIILIKGSESFFVSACIITIYGDRCRCVVFQGKGCLGWNVTWIMGKLLLYPWKLWGNNAVSAKWRTVSVRTRAQVCRILNSVTARDTKHFIWKWALSRASLALSMSLLTRVQLRCQFVSVELRVFGGEILHRSVELSVDEPKIHVEMH